MPDHIYSVLQYLLHNATGNLTSQAVDVTATVSVLNLPTDALQIIPWEGVVNGPAGSMPQTLWDWLVDLGYAILNAVVTAGQLLYGGLVAWWSFFIDLGQAVWAWGMHVVGEVWEAAVEVVEKANQVLQALVEWAEWFITAVLAAPINAMLALADAWLADVGRVLDLLFDPNGRQLTVNAAVASLQSALFSPGFWPVLLGVSIAIQALEGLLIGLTVGTGAGGIVMLVASIFSGELTAAVAKALLVGLGVGIAVFAGSLIYETIFPDGQTLDMPMAAGLTIGAFLVIGVQIIHASQTEAVWPGWWDVVGLALAVLGFVLATWGPDHVVNRLLITATGAAMAGLGLGIALFYHSPLDVPPYGYLDEGLDALSFGLSVAEVAAEAVP